MPNLTPPAQAGRNPKACCIVASPVLPAVPECCRTRPQWRYNQWKGGLSSSNRASTRLVSML